MNKQERRAALRLERCRRKQRYETWEDARAAGLAVWVEKPRQTDANPPAPYRCDVDDGHYHIGHLRFGSNRGATNVHGETAPE